MSPKKEAAFKLEAPQLLSAEARLLGKIYVLVRAPISEDDVLEEVEHFRLAAIKNLLLGNNTAFTTEVMDILANIVRRDSLQPPSYDMQHFQRVLTDAFEEAIGRK
jgi:hypothetical protein